MILKFRARGLLHAKSLKKLGWREVSVLFLKGLLAIFVAHMSPVVLLGGMYLNFILDLDLDLFLAYLLCFISYFLWISLQIFVCKKISIDVAYFMKVKFCSLLSAANAFLPLLLFAAIFFIAISLGDGGDENDGGGFFIALASHYFLAPVVASSSLLCFVYQTYCLIRSRKRPHSLLPWSLT